MQELIKVIMEGWPSTKEQVSPVVREFFQVRDELTTQGGLIYRGETTVVPMKMRKYMLNQLHQGHIGIDSTIRRARDILYWPKISVEIKSFIENCNVCNKFRCNQQKEALISHDFGKRPWQKFGLDIFISKRNIT